LKKHVTQHRSATATTMAGNDVKTPPASLKKSYGGKGGGDSESSRKGEIMRVIQEFDKPLS
jgi:hypothetical protein